MKNNNYFQGRQPSPWDVAFDRTLDFLLSNFTSHDFVWTVGSFTLDAKLFGLENVTRSCPIIIYETEEGGQHEMRFFARVCGEVPQLDLIGRTRLPARVSIILIVTNWRSARRGKLDSANNLRILLQSKEKPRAVYTIGA